METVILLDNGFRADSLPELGKGEQLHILAAAGSSIPVELLERCSGLHFKIHYISKPYRAEEIAMELGLLLADIPDDLMFIGKMDAITKLSKRTFVDRAGKEHHLIIGTGAKSAAKAVRKQGESKAVSAPPKKDTDSKRAEEEKSVKAVPKKAPGAVSKSAAEEKTTKTAPKKAQGASFKSAADVLKTAKIASKYHAVVLNAVRNAMDPITLEMMIRMQAATTPGCEDIDAEQISKALNPYFTQLKKLAE